MVLVAYHLLVSYVVETTNEYRNGPQNNAQKPVSIFIGNDGAGKVKPKEATDTFRQA